jgi:hypothetical protein
MAKKRKQAMVITMSGERPIHEVAHDLKTAGFDVSQVLEMVGSVTGTADPKIKKQLEGIRGVAHVGDDHPVSTASTDASAP